MVTNSTRGKRERIGRILRMHANKREELTEADAGNIYAAVGLQDTRTGDTLCDEKKPIILEKMIFPEPVISIAIEPKTKVDVEKLGVALQKLADRGPVVPRPHGRGVGPDDHQRHGRAPPRHHLRPPPPRVQGRVERRQARGRVPRGDREERSHCEYKYAKQSGGRGQYGHVLMEIGPGERGAGFVFENDIVGGVIPKEFIPADREGRQRGHGARRPRRLPARRPALPRSTTAATTTSTRARPAFEIAASLCFQDGAKRAGLHLLEPVMKNEVVVPEQYMGDVIGDLNSRRGKILGMSQRGNAQVIDAEVPLATMFGYVTDLRSMTQGRATSSLHFSHYAPVPAAVQEEVVAKVKGTSPGNALSTATAFDIGFGETVMAKEKFQRTKPHVNVGTIGHIDHGKTTLTAALVKVQSKKGLAKAISYADIAKGGTVRDETKTVTIAVSHVEYESREAPLRARRLPRPRRLHQEHDHGRGADGRRDPRRVARSTRSCRRRASTCCSRARSVSSTSSSC